MSRSNMSASCSVGPDQHQGSPDARDCRVRYALAGKTLAVVTIGRDRDSLRAEHAMEWLGAGHTAEQMEARLDDALAMTFPASDPVAIDTPSAQAAVTARLR